MKKWGLYEWSIILFFIAIPITASILDYYFFESSDRLEVIAFKWFVFSGVGLRLFSAGLKQVMQPQFTAQEIFNITDKKAIPIVKELGFANICFGTIALLSLVSSSFRVPATIAGGLYFGLAGLMHILKKKDSKEEMFAMISDLFIFVILAILLILSI